jgi:tRNA (guanine37-N1)-methyltransferase
MQRLFLPPLERGTKVLNRALFKQKVPISAARIFENKHIAEVRHRLRSSLLDVHKVANICSSPLAEDHELGRKMALLRPDIKAHGMSYQYPHWITSLARSG